MKRLIAVILSALMLCSCTEQTGSGGIVTPEENTIIKETLENDIPESETSEAPNIINETITVYDAETLYNLLIKHIDDWWYEEVTEYRTQTLKGGTLIDLDFDGVPEFLTLNTYNGLLTVYKLYDDELKEIYTFGKLGYDVAGKQVNAITTYTDENGKKSWVMYYYGDNTFYFSLFDFIGNDIIETVKFKEIQKNTLENYHTAEFYYGLPHANSELFIDGERFFAPEEETATFNIERDKAVAEYEKKLNEGLTGYDNTLPWSCVPYYAYPDIEQWREHKADFLAKLDKPAYKLIPNSDNYWGEDSWNNKDSVDTSLKKLVASYYENDAEYLKSEYLFEEYEGAMCKPVIYLYPEETTDINVQVAFPNGGDFTCTYPDYGDGWNVTAYPGGTLINKADRYEYSYLYWEGEGSVNWDFSSGFVVKGKDTAAFLREKLSFLGLKPREYNEFIVYWLPLMQNNPYNLITFQTTAYEESAILYVSPEPDSVLRAFMAYMPLKNMIDIPEQQLKKFERTGFSVIEWGGTCVK